MAPPGEIGAVLRKYSLDELPQLLNVLAGSMSLVGPRPPLPREVAQYGPDARRRLLVRPGITGLWQVSGRSDLSWQETVRLDLRYVENWSPALDALILWKTFGAVAATPLASRVHADSESDDEKRKPRYRESEEVKTYYRVNRYPS